MRMSSCDFNICMFFLRRRSKSEACPQRSNEGNTCFLRNSQSLMLLPHLSVKLALETRDSTSKRIESDLIVKFPEKSILLLAQDEDDQVQLELSSSSDVAPNSQQNEPRRKGDSGVQISDGAVLTWRSDLCKSEPTIPSSSTPISTQVYVRRVSTKSSLQSNYIPSLEKLIEEPLLPQKICKQQAKYTISEIAGSNERKEMGEVVVSHWTRAEQQRSDTRITTNQSCSFENRAPSSSLSLVNEVTEDVLFKRSSTNVSNFTLYKSSCSLIPDVCCKPNSEIIHLLTEWEGRPSGKLSTG